MRDQALYFPLMHLLPDFEENSINYKSYSLSKRLYEVSPFDIATLATKHKLHLPYQLMEVSLQHCNVELAIHEIKSLTSAKSQFSSLKLFLYVNKLTPFQSPVITTYSINDYAGINSRDSEALIQKLPVERRDGLKSDADQKLEAWLFEMELQNIVLQGYMKINEDQFIKAVDSQNLWEQYKRDCPILQNIENAASIAPRIYPIEQSIMYIWTAIESLFPNINAELTFKLSLYLSQLNCLEKSRLDYYSKIKKAYSVRSKIAHGNKIDDPIREWINAWSILMHSIQSIIMRARLPDEQQLLRELLK